MVVWTHPDCLSHNAGSGHPESPERLRVLLKRVREDGRFGVQEARPATREPLLAVHPAHYLDHLEQVADGGGGALDPDTILNGQSWNAALGAAGAVLAAVADALAGRPAFAAVRPPGHHALADRAMGFCLLANAVIGVRAAEAAGVSRSLIVDWDVHHGNGTQALVERDHDIRFVSLHEWPAYPGTGAASERGVGNLFNLPMPAGLPAPRYVEALWGGILAATTGWTPDLVVISAGFDAMAGDPLGGFTLEPGDYAEFTRRLRDRLPEVPVVAVLEGGYRPQRLADGVLAVLTAI